MITHITEHIISIACVQCIEEQTKKQQPIWRTRLKNHTLLVSQQNPYRKLSLIASYLYNSQNAAKQKNPCI